MDFRTGCHVSEVDTARMVVVDMAVVDTNPDRADLGRIFLDRMVEVTNYRREVDI